MASQKIVLYTTDYFCDSVKRRREIQMVQNSNAKLDMISKIIVLYEKWDNVPPEVKSTYSNEKFQVINCPKRQTYRDLYEHSRQNHSDSIIVISNSDIYFDKTLYRLNELVFGPNTLYAITRWDRVCPNIDKSFWTPPFQGSYSMNWSYDVYCFKNPVNIIPETIDIKVGIGGCDTYLVKKLIVDNNIKVYDPMLDIRAWHQDYRDEEKLDKSYYYKEQYKTRKDYPSCTNTWTTAVIPFGSNKGLDMTFTNAQPVLQTNYIIRKLLKVISFSLWGAELKYTKGAIKNAELALTIYPEWRCWFYIHEESVPKEIIDELKQFPNVDIIIMKDLVLAMSTRFISIDEPSVEVMISRDCDSQLGERERAAVDEWLQSDKALHVMRDHPCHGKYNGHRILGGMFGMKKVGYWQGWKKEFIKYINRHGEWGLDQTILQEVVYPLFDKHNDIMVHASFNKFESYARDFPVDFDPEYHFVGGYHYWDGTRNLEHVEMIRRDIGKIVVDTCVVSCNLNDFYLDFFPIVHAMWKDLCNIRCVLILVGDHIPKKLSKYSSDIILFSPEPGINDIFQAQMLRLLYAGLMRESKGVHVSDIDLLPMCKNFYVNIPNKFENDKFVVYRDIITCDNQYPVCFNVASPKIWREIYQINTEQDVGKVLRELYPKNFDGQPGKSGWYTDQLSLFNLVNKWNDTKGRRRIILNDKYTNFKRLDRSNMQFITDNKEQIISQINNQEYTDFHMPRPYSDYSKQILELVKGLLTEESVSKLVLI